MCILTESDLKQIMPRANAALWVGALGIEFSDKAALDAVTLRINGGLNGIAERRRYYQTACDVLGVR